MESELVERFRQPDFSDDQFLEWREEDDFIETRVLRLDKTSSEVTYTVHVPEIFRYVLPLVAAVLPVSIIGGKPELLYFGLIGSIFGFLAMAMFIYIPKSDQYQLQSISICKEYFGYFGLAVVFAVTSPFHFGPHQVLIYTILGAVFLGHHYTRGTLPLQSRYFPKPTRSLTHLQIPLTGLLAPMAAFLLMNLYSFLRLSTLPLWTAVILSLIGSVISLYAYSAICLHVMNNIQSQELAPYESRIFQTVVLAVYLGLTGLSLLVLGVLFEWVAIGLTGGSVVFSISAEVTQTVSGMYQNLDAVFAAIPVGSPRLYSVSFFIALLSPFLILFVYWATFLYRKLRTRLWIHYKGEKRFPGFSMGESDIPVIEIDSGSPVVHPVSWFMGQRKAVVVDQMVRESLSRQEFEAVYTHEVYHLRNQEIIVTIISTLLPFLFFGGRNSLLAIYDYPRIEQEADQFAAEQVGKQPLQNALRKIENLQLQSSGKTELLDTISASPGFTGTGHEVPDIDELLNIGETNVREFLTRQRQFLFLPYQLFFGSILYDKAHRTVDERIKMISNNSD